MKLLDWFRGRLSRPTKDDAERLKAITARLQGAPYTLALLDPQGFELSDASYCRQPFDPSKTSSVVTWKGLSPGTVVGGWRVYGLGPFNGFQGQFPSDYRVGMHDTLFVNFSGALLQ